MTKKSRAHFGGGDGPREGDVLAAVAVTEVASMALDVVIAAEDVHVCTLVIWAQRYAEEGVVGTS